MQTDNNTIKDCVNEPASAIYGMSANLRESGLLSKIESLSRKDKVSLVRYIYGTERAGIDDFEHLNDEQQPYTLEELNARIDESEAEIERGEGESFEEMMNRFKKELLWLK